MNVLVTGAAGFIGSHVSEYLSTKKEIKKIILVDDLSDGKLKNLSKIINLRKVEFKKSNICDKKIHKYLKTIDVVIHLAALSDVVPSIENPFSYMNTNVMGTLNILEGMRKYKVKKIIYAASSSCYGIPKVFPTQENSNINPQYPYAFSKYIGEETIKHWSKVYGINYVSLRLFNVYGTRSRTNGAYGAALGIFLKQKLSKKPFTIVGNGEQKRDFIYVTDVANAFYLAINKRIKNKIFNIGSSNPQSVNQMVKLLGGKKIFIPKRPGEPDKTFASIKKAKKELKWKQKISFNQGISIVLKNINYWKNAPLWDKRKISLATKNWFKYLK